MSNKQFNTLLWHNPPSQTAFRYFVTYLNKLGGVSYGLVIKLSKNTVFRPVRCLSHVRIHIQEMSKQRFLEKPSFLKWAWYFPIKKPVSYLLLSLVDSSLVDIVSQGIYGKYVHVQALIVSGASAGIHPHQLYHLRYHQHLKRDPAKRTLIW